MDLLYLGKVTKAVGLKGQVRVFSDSDFVEERFKKGTSLKIELNNQLSDVTVLSASFSGNIGTVLFNITKTREEAEKLRDALLYIDRNQVKSLAKDDYYYFDLKDCDVLNTNHQLIGKVIEVLEQPSSAVLRIQDNQGDFLVPFVKAFVKEVDIQSKKIVIEMVEGLR